MDDQKILERLLDISLQLAENRALEPLLCYTIDTALEVFRAEFGYLILLDETGELDFRVRRDCLGHDLEMPETQVSHTILNTVIHEGRDWLIANALADPNLQSSESVHHLHLRSVMCVPLISRQRVIGALYVENRAFASTFSEQDLKPMKLFAAQAAMAIENAIWAQDLETRVAQRTAELTQEIEARKKLQADLERLASTDSLTGILNRRRFFELAEYELGRSERYHHPLSIILLDVDHFKIVNDVFGHIVGDSVLAGVAKLFGAELRQSDILARYGGEEFVVLLPETDLAHANDAAERLRKAVAMQEFKISQGGVSTTISLGVACTSPDQPISLDRLLERVDKALYAAKNGGRNRVACG